jgi:hypothetical protein
MPLVYHDGQRAVQDEAKTRIVADRLADWVGPVGEFSAGADMFLLATEDGEGALRFTVLSGPPPFVEIVGPSTLRLPVPPSAVLIDPEPAPSGGLAINLSTWRRARMNGMLAPEGRETCTLETAETFTLCRKYMAPSIGIGDALQIGPVAREPLALDDPWLAVVLATAEAAFLASISPSGGPDVAHRGGPPGFITLDADERRLTWPEYIGDGVFKSAGNVRATGAVTLLVLDIASGDGVELTGRGDYVNVRTDREDRRDPLVRHAEPYPIQGVIQVSVERALRLRTVTHPRERIEKALKVTSCSTVDEQAPR